jgi:hypothetical protein
MLEFKISTSLLSYVGYHKLTYTETYIDRSGLCKHIVDQSITFIVCHLKVVCFLLLCLIKHINSLAVVCDVRLSQQICIHCDKGWSCFPKSDTDVFRFFNHLFLFFLDA